MRGKDLNSENRENGVVERKSGRETARRDKVGMKCGRDTLRRDQGGMNPVRRFQDSSQRLENSEGTAQHGGMSLEECPIQPLENISYF